MSNEYADPRLNIKPTNLLKMKSVGGNYTTQTIDWSLAEVAQLPDCIFSVSLPIRQMESGNFSRHTHSFLSRIIAIKASLSPVECKWPSGVVTSSVFCYLLLIPPKSKRIAKMQYGICSGEILVLLISPILPVQNGESEWCCLSWQKIMEQKRMGPDSQYSVVL